MQRFPMERIKSYPEVPGVYLMKGKDGAFLYIGKAKNLKSRIKQYFSPGGDGRWIAPFLQAQVLEVETVVTLTEKEALLLECNLIKKHQPKFNALLKDDKTYTALKINIRHSWPMLSLVRYKGKLRDDALYFGPYTSAYAARATLDFLQKIFPMRQCSDQELISRKRPCILYGIKRCSAPCVGLVSKERYDGYVDACVKFLKGQSSEVLEILKKGIEEASAGLNFERAKELYDLLLNVEKTLQPQSVDKVSGVTAEVLAIFRKGDEVVLSQLTFDHGRLSSYRHHNFSRILESDEELLESFIVQQYAGKMNLPKLILIPERLENQKIIEEIFEGKVSLAVPERGEKRALVEMAIKNAEAAFHQKKDKIEIQEKALLQIQEKFHLQRYPEKIECLDTSHLSGREAVSAIVAFKNGEPFKEDYRRYKLKNTDSADDYGAIKEVLFRRFEKECLPDLLVIDGGKGHLNMALKVLKEMNIITVDVISMAKEKGRHDRGATQEQVFIENVKDPILLPAYAPALFLLQRIRDEAHRFAIGYQKKRRSITTIRSQLSSIFGIGPVKQKSLLQKFGSVKGIVKASDEDLLSVPGITQNNIKALREGLKDVF